MRTHKIVLTIIMSLLLVYGGVLAEEKEVKEKVEVEAGEQVKAEEKATDEAKEGTVEDGESAEKEGTAKAEETATAEATEGTESAEGAEGAEKEVKEEAKPEEKAEVKEEVVPEPKPKSLNEELKVMAVGVDRIVDRLSKMQDNAKKKKKLSSDLADLEDKIGLLRKQSEVVRELNEAFTEKGKAHFAAWGQKLPGLESELLRKKGEKRRSKQSEAFKDFQDKMAEIIEKASVSFKSRLEETASYLKYDLRPESVSEISGDINKIKKAGGNISKLIGDARKDLKSLPVF